MSMHDCRHEDHRKIDSWVSREAIYTYLKALLLNTTGFPAIVRVS